MVFLQGCSSFNKPVNLNNASIGNSFFYNCDNMTSKTTVNSNNMSGNAQTLATINLDAPMYTQGVPIAGINAQALMNWNPNTTVIPFRKLNLA